MIKETTIFTPEEAQTFETIEEFKNYGTSGGILPPFTDQFLAAGIDVTDDSVYQEALVETDEGSILKMTIAYADQEQIDAVRDAYGDYQAGIDVDFPVTMVISTASEDHLF